MVGIVGAGGIGGTLFSAFQRFDYDFVCTILITIITIIMLGELLAGVVRSILLDNVSPAGLFKRKTYVAPLQRPIEDDA
jgi:phosphonate transport system permease protein